MGFIKFYIFLTSLYFVKTILLLGDEYNDRKPYIHIGNEGRSFRN